MTLEYIPLEKPIFDLEQKIDELKRLAIAQNLNLDNEISELEIKIHKLRDEIFENLNAYDTTQLARHPKRPTTLDLISLICSDFIELHGDRNFADDKAIVGGLAKIDNNSIIIIGHQKGKNTKENIERNFGMAKPEGYRKALRLMNIAERFKLPIITLIDTPGAYPGVDAEERGQSEAIAKNIMIMSKLKVPIITIITGEGGSGGALAMAVANKVHMLRYAIYSVISPEGCASILMKDASKAAQTAEALRLTAPHTLKLGIIDSIIPEPPGGAHKNITLTASNIKKQILQDLQELSKLSGEECKNHRIQKYLSISYIKEVSMPYFKE